MSLTGIMQPFLRPHSQHQSRHQSRLLSTHVATVVSMTTMPLGFREAAHRANDTTTDLLTMLVAENVKAAAADSDVAAFLFRQLRCFNHQTQRVKDGRQYPPNR